MKKTLTLLGFLAVLGLTAWQMNREVEVEEKKPVVEAPVTQNLPSPHVLSVKADELPMKPKTTETKPKSLGAVYKFNPTYSPAGGTSTPYGVWQDAQTGEVKFYDKNGKFYTNTEEILEMQKPKLIKATSTQ